MNNRLASKYNLLLKEKSLTAQNCFKTKCCNRGISQGLVSENQLSNLMGWYHRNPCTNDKNLETYLDEDVKPLGLGKNVLTARGGEKGCAAD